MNRLVLEAAELAEPRAVELERGEAVVFSRPAPDKTSGNEDAAAVFELQGGAVVLAVADGLGGGPAGAPKFPQAMALTFLLRWYRRTGAPSVGAAHDRVTSTV